ncbi:MAG: arylsulfatase [Cyclobacteriaceae bacterium]|nr:arylsulfatase [Cyclobacteriaceae bacterium]
MKAYLPYFPIVFFIFFSCNQKNQQKPNILLIMADDLGWSDIGCYGSEVSTPNLDRLASNGIRFTQMHNTSKCFPSRATLLTGIYAQQNGYALGYNQPLKNAVTLGEVLQSAGYRTLWSGKHHGVETPVDRGFDHYYGLREGASNHFNPGPQREGEVVPAQKRPDRPFFIDHQLFQPYSPPKDFYTTDYFTKYALEWLDKYKEDDKPFFLYMAYTAPHDPLMAWPADIDKYKGVYDEGYTAIRARRYAKQKELGLTNDSYILSEESYDPWDLMSDSLKRVESLKMTVYAAMIDRMDQKIGEILDKIEAMGKLENTLVLFVSDNGSSAEVVNIAGDGQIGTLGQWTSLGKNWANVSNTPFRYYKNYSFEGGICTPMIAYWPTGIGAKNAISRFPAHFIDIMPTLAEIAGADYPSTHLGQKIVPMQGMSLLPILKGEKLEREKPLYWQWQKGKAVRDGKWKIVAHGEHAEWELYNMDNDATETENLASSHPEIVLKMNELFVQWEKENEQWN